ncbi:MAG: DUF6629 family protein [Bacteroidota bacterium]
MCFSATASFSASVVIGLVGIATIRSCKKREEIFLGAVPFLFALQQVSEGFVWLSIRNSDFLAFQHLFSLCFLFFAWVVWPILIPLAFYKLEPNSTRKLWCKRLIYVGIASGLYAIFNMAAKYPVPNIATFHIIYKVQKSYHHDFFFIPHQTAYILATVLPMFLSSLKGVKLLAIANFIALLLCFIFFQYALPSTWCFFAAFLSAIIYRIINHPQNRMSLLPQ